MKDGWLRYFDRTGTLVLGLEEAALREQEQAEQEQRRAEQAERRDERLAQHLRELGIDLDRE